MATTGYVKLEDIVLPAHQPRYDIGDVQDIVNAITSTGAFNSALSLKRRADGKLELICGRRRYMAMCEVVATQPDFPPLVSAIVYAPDELDAVTEWKLAFDENERREPLTPIDRARAIVELRLRLDCTELRQQLAAANIAAELPDSLEAWQAEYERLVQLAEAQGRDSAALLTTTWREFDTYVGISERDRRRCYQLARLAPPVQDALRHTALSERQQIAICAAPSDRQLALIEVVAAEADTPVLVIEAVASLLKDERITAYSATDMLKLTQAAYHTLPSAKARDVGLAVLTQLAMTESECNATKDITSDMPNIFTDAVELTAAQATELIDTALAASDTNYLSAALITKQPQRGKIRDSDAQEEDKIERIVAVLERAIEHYDSYGRTDLRERLIGRLRQMLNQLEALHTHPTTMTTLD